MIFKQYLMSMIVAVIVMGTPLKVHATDFYNVQLYFGLSIPDGGAVSDAQWDDFVASHIVTRFDGFNVIDSLGYWKGKAEKSKVVTIILPAQQLAKAKQIANQYAELYHQDSVMLVHNSVSTSL